jgi:hypothetical protein
MFIVVNQVDYCNKIDKREKSQTRGIAVNYVMELVFPNVQLAKGILTLTHCILVVLFS